MVKPSDESNAVEDNSGIVPDRAPKYKLPSDASVPTILASDLLTRAA